MITTIRRPLSRQIQSKAEKFKRILALYESGIPAAEIAVMFKMTRQGIYYAINKAAERRGEKNG